MKTTDDQLRTLDRALASAISIAGIKTTGDDVRAIIADLLKARAALRVYADLANWEDYKEGLLCPRLFAPYGSSIAATPGYVAARVALGGP